MAYTYLPKNKLDGTVTLDKIALEFAAIKSSDDFSTSIKCEETTIGKITNICTGSSSPAIVPRGICWGGVNGQYLFIITPNTIYRIETSTDRPVGVTSDYHWNSDFDLVANGSATSRVIGTGSTTGLVENNGQGIAFNPDGTICVITGDGNSVSEFSLTTPWDLSTLTYVRKFSLTNRKIKEYAPTDLCYSDNGKKLFIIGAFKDRVHILNLSTPFSLSGSVYNTYFDLIDAAGGKLIEYPSSIAFSDAGKSMYVSGYISPSLGRIFKYELSLPYDPTTAFFSDEFNITSYETEPLSIAFSKFGTVKNHPTGGSNTLYDIKDNLLISGVSNLFTLELPPVTETYNTPVKLSDFYRGKNYIPVEITGPALNIPIEFDQSKIIGFSDSAIEKTNLEYNDSFNTASPYTTYGIDFSFDGDYAFVNRADSNDTDIIRIPTTDKKLNLFSYNQDSTQSFSIAAQKLGGINADAIANSWTRFSHGGVDYPANSWELLVNYTYDSANNRIISNNVNEYAGIINPAKVSSYSMSGFVTSGALEANPIGVVSGFNEFGTKATELGYPSSYSITNALIYYAGSFTDPLVGKDKLKAVLEARGFTVTFSTYLPSDLSPYQQIWDLNFENTALSITAATKYREVLARGGFVYLTGENAGFPNRNNSLSNFVYTVTGYYLGSVTTDGSSIFNLNQTYCPSTTYMTGSAVGVMTATNAVPIAWPGTYTGKAGFWAWFGNQNQMYNQYTGTLMLGFDINWFNKDEANNALVINDFVDYIANSAVPGINYMEATISVERFPVYSTNLYDNNTIIKDLSTTHSAAYSYPNLPTFSITLNANKIPTATDFFNAEKTILIKGPIKKDRTQLTGTTQNWSIASTYFEVKKENEHLGIFLGGLLNPDEFSSNYTPSATRDDDWDWKNLNSSVTEGFGYYINLLTGEYKYKDFGDPTVINGTGTITDSNILNSLLLFSEETGYGFSRYDGTGIHSDIHINGTPFNINPNNYLDKFATHKIGKGGYKLFTAVNTSNLNDSLYTSQILSYDLLTKYDLNDVSYSNEILYTHDRLNTINGKINSFDFGKDSFEVEGKVLYTLSDLTDSTNIIDQYSLATTWNISSAVKQYNKSISNSEIGFKPTLMSLTNNGNNIVFAGKSNKIKIGTLSTPYLIDTLSFTSGPTSIFETPLSSINTLWVANDFSELVVGDSDSDILFKFENKLKNPISFSNFFDSI